MIRRHSQRSTAGGAHLVIALTMLASACDSPVDPGPVAVESVTIEPVAPVLAVGDSLRIQARMVALGGVPVETAVSWRSEVDSVAVVRADGRFAVIRALRPGTTRLLAEADGKVGTATLTVVAVQEPGPPPAARIVLTPGAGSLEPNGQRTVRAQVLSADGGELIGLPITWESTDASVLEVEAGPSEDVAVVRAVGLGRAGVVARSQGVSAQAAFEVSEPEPVRAVFVSPAKKGVWVDHYTAFTAIALGPNGGTLQGRRFTMWTDDPQVAEIDANGHLRGVSPGVTRLVAESGGVRGYAEVHVYELAPRMTFQLTYDWWDGQVRLMEPLDRTTWTDEHGVEHEALLYATSGLFTVDFNDGTWERVTAAEAHAVVGGVVRKVAAATYTGSGSVMFRWGNDGTVSMNFVEAEDPQPVYQGVFRSGGELLVGLPVLGGQRDFLFRLPG